LLQPTLSQYIWELIFPAGSFFKDDTTSTRLVFSLRLAFPLGNPHEIKKEIGTVDTWLDFIHLLFIHS
jgi:hypothetical protein